jgi:hypothetical protein
MTKKLEQLLKSDQRSQILKRFRRSICDQIGPMTTEQIWEFFGDPRLHNLRDRLPVRLSALAITNELVSDISANPAFQASDILMKMAQDASSEEIYSGSRQDLSYLDNESDM